MIQIYKKARKLLLALFIIYLFLFLFADFYFIGFLVLILFAFYLKEPKREVANFNEDTLLSPMDLQVKSIVNDTENSQIKIICKKKLCYPSTIKAVTKCDDLFIKKQQGLMGANDINSKAFCLEFQENIKIIFKINSYFSFLDIAKTCTLQKGETIGFFTFGEVEINLAYNCDLLIGLNDKILANQAIAKLGS